MHTPPAPTLPTPLKKTKGKCWLCLLRPAFILSELCLEGC
jgi:hypothetical protein